MQIQRSEFHRLTLTLPPRPERSPDLLLRGNNSAQRMTPGQHDAAMVDLGSGPASLA